MKEVDEIISWLESNRNVKNTEGMSRFGINVGNAYGVSMPMLRAKSKEYRRNHELALELWKTGIHEARIMAGIIADPKKLEPETMDEWTADFDSWDICDQCCINLFRKTPYAHEKVAQYVADEREFVRRAGFVLIATLAVHDKESYDEVFISYLDVIERYSEDERNFVRKAVNWALRQIGKRNIRLNAPSVELAAKLSEASNATARWIGKDAYRELSSEKTINYIKDHRQASRQ